MSGDAPTRRRADALQNEQRILEAARQLLARSPSTSLAEIAAAARISRSTLYRHFKSREDLIAAIGPLASEDGHLHHETPLPTGELGRARGVTLDAIQVFDMVPPPVLPEQLVAEAERLAGVPVALYVVDIDGSHLLRIAGATRLADQLEAPLAVGPELDASSISEVRARLEGEAGARVIPLWLRGRATGVLISFGRPNASLTELARQASAAVTLADRYTDTFARSQRRKQPKAAAEIQQSLLPPRISRVTGGEVAGNVLPSYEVAGDWFDVIENADGIWVTLAEGLGGSGTRAAASSAVALGALRASRRSDAEISEALLVMHQTLKEMPGPRAEMTAIVTRWDPATHELRAASCGQASAFLVRAGGEHEQLRIPESRGLGGRSVPKPVEHTIELGSGDRLILASDGVIGPGKGKAALGAEGVIEAALLDPTANAADTVRQIHTSVLDASGGQLEDDATVVCLFVG
jgi:serine phosphatase RsbU (regulator of sigma subunit)